MNEESKPNVKLASGQRTTLPKKCGASSSDLLPLDEMGELKFGLFVVEHLHQIYKIRLLADS